jgi:hypothetical protein
MSLVFWFYCFLFLICSFVFKRRRRISNSWLATLAKTKQPACSFSWRHDWFFFAAHNLLFIVSLFFSRCIRNVPFVCYQTGLLDSKNSEMDWFTEFQSQSTTASKQQPCSVHLGYFDRHVKRFIKCAMLQITEPIIGKTFSIFLCATPFSVDHFFWQTVEFQMALRAGFSPKPGSSWPYLWRQVCFHEMFCLFLIFCYCSRRLEFRFG